MSRAVIFILPLLGLAILWLLRPELLDAASASMTDTAPPAASEASDAEDEEPAPASRIPRAQSLSLSLSERASEDPATVRFTVRGRILLPGELAPGAEQAFRVCVSSLAGREPRLAREAVAGPAGEWGPIELESAPSEALCLRVERAGTLREELRIDFEPEIGRDF